MNDVLEQDGFYRVQDYVSEGDTVYLRSTGEVSEFETEGKIVTLNKREVSRNNVLIVKIQVEEGTVNVYSDGSVTLFRPGDELRVEGEYSPSQNPQDKGLVKELEVKN
jgi:flagellar basal body rod protein FlgG